ncbi:MAG: hypothetical protein QM500_04375 [Methylococcales bacterium]
MSLKKLTLALFVSVAMLGVAPSTMAKPAGKIENATPAATVIAIAETIELSEKALQAIKDGSLEKPEMMALFKTVKQRAKTIESTTTYMLREKALGRLGKARLAYKKGHEKAEVITKMEKAVEYFKQMKVRFDEFN